LITWTIGAGGLLGSAIQRNSPHSFTGPVIPWQDTTQASELLRRTAQSFAQAAGDSDWAVIWAAGSASTSSSAEQAALELQTLTAVVDAVREQPPAGVGVFFLASSAGGVYAGAENPPFDDSTPPAPLSAYGELKLAQEQAARRALEDVCSVVIGRIANLYGPGQNLDKLQGLISRLALASVTKQPINMFVSLDTMRDYIFTEDAAMVCLHWIAQAHRDSGHQQTIKVIASGQPVSLAYLIHLAQDIGKVKVPIAFGSHSSSSAQALDLRLRPTDAAQIEHLIRTPLAVGTKLVYLDILERFRLASAVS